MAQAIAAKDVTLRELKQNFGIQISQDAAFFNEWLDGFTPLSEEDRNYSGLNFNNIFQEVIKEEVGLDE
jgi:hypothetical protein